MEEVNYNAEPVFYCKNCLSLKIMDGGFIDYCDNCNSTDVDTASLEEYDEMHQKRFGEKYFYK